MDRSKGSLMTAGLFRGGNIQRGPSDRITFLGFKRQASIRDMG